VPIANAFCSCQAPISKKHLYPHILKFSQKVLRYGRKQTKNNLETIKLNDNLQKPRQITIGSRQFTLPQSRALRILIGYLLVFFGFLGFLPILGFWMIPLGLWILSQEYGWLRRVRRRFGLWWARRKLSKSADANNKAK
jgi:hypothetical protein